MTKLIDKIKWLYGRWKIMDHPQEEIYRIGQQVQYRIIDKRWSKHNPDCGEYHYDYTGNIFSIEGLKKVVDNTFIDISRYPVLNEFIDDIISNNLWNYDFKNKKKGQENFVHNIDDFSYELGDIRYLYELGRIHWAPVITAYAIAKSDSTLLLHVKNMLREWSVQNPYLKTIAWKSGNEVGIRAINLIYMRILLGLFSKNEDYGFENFFNRLIELHFIFLRSHQSLYSSKGNHHIGELAGMISICSVYSFEKRDKWLSQYFNELQSEILRLIDSDGFNKEQSTNYQTSYINLIMTAVTLAATKGMELNNDSHDRMRRAYDFLRSMRVKKAEFFHIGDTDNAELLFPYADKEYNIYESMLNDAAIFFGARKAADYHYDLRNYLLTGDYGHCKYDEAEIWHPQPQCSLFKESGYFVIHDHNINLIFDCGPIGLEPSMCHGHSDMLCTILYVKGKSILVDCGCYQYLEHFRKYRDYFHGVTSHNTISIDNQNQAKLGRGMFWLTYPQAKIIDSDMDCDVKYCEASHNGYEHLGVKIKRRVEYHTKEKIIIIIDKIQASGKHKAIMHYHFHPQSKVRLNANRLIVDGVVLSNELFRKGRILFGNEELPYGWYSKRYDEKEPTHSFMADVQVEGIYESKTIIDINKLCVEF